MFSSSKEVHAYYLERTKEVIGERDLTILKTDCFNEAGNNPIEGGIAGNIRGNVIMIEISTEIMKEAKGQILLGDIRNLPFRDEWFDMILDFSTIDHIPVSDLGRTIAGYRRCIKRDGELLMFAWCGKDLPEPTDQHYFDIKILKEVIGKHFIIKKFETVLQDRKYDPPKELIEIYAVAI